MEKQKLRTRFALVIGAILAVCLAVLSAFLYFQLRSIIINDAYLKAHIVLAEVKAAQAYVRETLRPKMYDILPPGEFIPEAMSTTFVSREIAKNFNEDFPEYYFKFAALNPRNTLNEPDGFELKKIKEFDRNRAVNEWRGVIDREGEKYFAYLSPILMEEACLKCHGDPSDAPKALVEIYGSEGGFDRKVGDVVAIRSVAIPVGLALAQARNITVLVVLLGLACFMILFLLINKLFGGLVVGPISELKRPADEIGKGNYDVKIEPASRDEIGELASIFKQMSVSLKKSRGELERSYEDLKELDKLKSEFVATASHELRSPLGIVRGYLEVVRDGILGEVNEAQEERLAKALAHVDELTSLTNDLLDLSRIEAKKWKIAKKPLVLAEVVTSVLAEVDSKAKEKKHEIEVDIPSKFPKVRVDKESLTRVLVNLLDNAVKFTPEEGKIAIHALDEKEKIHIVVEDNGIGISQEHLPRIFDRFYTVESSLTRKLAGVGLGLSIAKGIVEAHGGEIWAESTPGEGTKVHFTLPK